MSEGRSVQVRCQAAGQSESGGGFRPARRHRQYRQADGLDARARVVETRVEEVTATEVAFEFQIQAATARAGLRRGLDQQARRGFHPGLLPQAPEPWFVLPASTSAESKVSVNAGFE